MKSIQKTLAAAAVGLTMMTGAAMAQEAEQPLSPEEQATINLLHEFFECTSQKNQASENEIAALDSAAIDEKLTEYLKNNGLINEGFTDEEVAAVLHAISDEFKKVALMAPLFEENHEACLTDLNIDEVATDENLDAIVKKYGEDRIWDELEKLGQQAVPAPSGP